MRISDLTPHINYIHIGDGQLVELHWCNAAMIHALAYARYVTGLDVIDLEAFLLTSENPVTCMALIYGALRCQGADAAADMDTWYSYELARPAVIDGLHAYLPQGADEPLFGTLDESWPESRRLNLKRPGLDFGDIFRLLKQHGYSVTEISGMTWTGMYGALGVEGGGGESWLDSTSEVLTG